MNKPKNHKIQHLYVQDVIQNYTACLKLGKAGLFSKENKTHRCHSQKEIRV